MSGRVEKIYFGPTLPSESLRMHLGPYLSLFRTEDCGDCYDDIHRMMTEGRLIFKGRPYQTVAYPVVVTGGKGHLIANPSDFEELVGCGSL